MTGRDDWVVAVWGGRRGGWRRGARDVWCFVVGSGDDDGVVGWGACGDGEEVA